MGAVLSNHAQSIVQTLNTKYGDSFVFSGNDGMTVPFSWDESSGELLFRGISVNSGDAIGPPARPTVRRRTRAKQAAIGRPIIPQTPNILSLWT